MANSSSFSTSNNLKNYVLSLDVGGSNVRAYLYDRKAAVIGCASQKLQMIYVGARGIEVNPDVLWKQVLEVVKAALADGNIQAYEVASMGISVQRGLFLLWDNEKDKPFHNFISWQDMRGEYIERSWNNSRIIRAVKAGAKVAYWLTKRNRFLAAAVINFRANHVTIRLLWALEKYPEIRQKARQGRVRLMTLDTWLFFKLTNGKTYATEMSNASATGVYDPYIRDWSGFFGKIMDIPMELFPPVWDTDADFGSCESECFGAEIPIRAALGDQQSAIFGQCCFEEGEVKITMGTGTFMDINVGAAPHASVEGFYPVTAWKRGAQLVHFGEGNSFTAGVAVSWLVDTFSIESPAHSQSLAESVKDSNGVYFVPSFSGLQAPDNDYTACGSLMGLNSSVTKSHIARAVLEALAFRTAQVFQSMTSEVRFPVKRVVCDGGVSANDFVVQLIADLIGWPIQRMKQLEMSALGAAFMAGRAVGFWKSDESLKDLITVDKVFRPDKKRALAYGPVIEEWKKAIERSKKWYTSN